ncbi:hypothetical protein RHECIAT_CH0000516 [Rhizobium etli CIAT 652]|uniref:Uncharacterized protein n=1 Tax=Rhizobium etli (strain CIAT 652) TaxID=491916 RepID=B3Q077_RHIE6|nr:hypothetical protein RHECIAT_CH0000516 [Rhizobium etli CIAT 652]
MRDVGRGRKDRAVSPSPRERGPKDGSRPVARPRRWLQPDEGLAIGDQRGLIFQQNLTNRSKMPQNEAASCCFEGKHCAGCIAALRYFRYSRSNEWAIYISVSSALLLPALLHRTDNTPPPSCQSGSRAWRTSSRARLFSFSQQVLHHAV